jgi:hypothetical protein
MKLTVSTKLIDSYKANSKNPNYSLSFLLNSIDPSICADGLGLVETFKLAGAAVEYEIDDKNIRVMQQLFGNVDSTTVERLLWVALLFPEI